TAFGTRERGCKGATGVPSGLARGGAGGGSMGGAAGTTAFTGAFWATGAAGVARFGGSAAEGGADAVAAANKPCPREAGTQLPPAPSRTLVVGAILPSAASFLRAAGVSGP